MTIGKIRRTASLLLRHLAPALLLCLPLPALAGWDLPALMRTLAEQPGSRSEFVETKQLAVLQSTLETRGTLEFRPPDYLRRSQQKPRQEEFEVRGDTVTVRRPDQPPQQITLSEHPPLAAFIDALRATLAGDLETLQRHYGTELRGSPERWQLQLRPRPGPLASHIEYITLHGAQGRLLQIETQEISGDRSVTRITPLRD